MRYRSLVLAAALIATPAAADDLAAKFANRPMATTVALSPLGDKIVYVGAYKTGGKAVTVADLKTGETQTILAGATLDVVPQSCRFKTETRLVCSLYGVFSKDSSFARVMAIDIDGKNRKQIGLQGHWGEVLNWLPDDPKHVMMLPGPATVDIDTGLRRSVDTLGERVAQVATDAVGNVRLKGVVDLDADGMVRDTIGYSVRARGSRDWTPLERAKISDEQAFAFAGFDAENDNLFALKLLDGRKALFTIATDGTRKQTLVFAHPAVDVDGVARIGKYRRPVGASFAVERNEVHYFDAKLAALSASLKKALPDHPDVTIADESWDGSKLLIYVDGDNVPGRYYLYDATTRKLGELLPVYPALDGVALGKVAAVRYPARDGTMIPGYLTLPPGRSDARGLPGLVMPHGGPSARDTAGFDWLPQFFAAQGYAVLQPNFRGSAGYGAEFFAKNGFQSWRLAIGDVNDGARWLITQGATANKLAIFGWSYGGYAALQANVAEPGLYKATIAVAPVTDLPNLRDAAQRYSNFKLVSAMVGVGDHVLSGSPARNAAKIVSPVLIFHADKDLNVDIAQSRTMVSALRSAGKSVDFIEYKGLDHQIDDSASREDLLTRSAAFLKASLN